MKKKYKRLIILFVVIALLAIGCFLIFKMLKKDDVQENVNVVDSISEYAKCGCG